MGRVLPGWLRPDARGVAFTLSDQRGGSASGTFTLGDFQGKVVLLCLVDGMHPAPSEAVTYLRDLARMNDPGFKFHLLYQPRREDGASASTWIEFAYDLTPALPAGPKAFRPLGEVRTFPTFFVIDRKGRIRQRWAGFGQALTDAAIQAARAEP